MTDYSELKRLAEAATPGRWTAYDTHGRRFIEALGTEDHVVCATPKKQWLKDSEYIAAADPTAVLALIADVKDFREQYVRDSSEMITLIRGRDDARKERDQLKAEVETLRSQVAALQSDANSWQSGYDEGRRMGNGGRQ